MKRILHEVEGRSIDLQSAQHNFLSLLIFEKMGEHSKYLMQDFIGDVLDGSDVDCIQEKMDDFLPFAS